jgi:5S rRNA maturation endonuclease (ribonuclease M5)
LKKKRPQIVVGKRDIKDLDSLVFDPENPRLPSSVNGSKEQEVLAYMIDKSKIVELMLSIGEQDYFDGEPLLVIPSTKKGKFIVVEGNRRLAALKLLKDPKSAPDRSITINEVFENSKYWPGKIPVIEYAERDEILLYLGYRHITGVNEWDSLAKAKYLFKLKEKYKKKKYNEILKILAKIIGSRADYVHKLLSGYEVYKVIQENDFYNIPGLNEDTLKFSLLTTALSYNEISRFVGINESVNSEKLSGIKKAELRELTEWIFKKEENISRLGDSRNLGTLAKVVSSSKALIYFRKGRSLEQARIFTDEPAEVLHTLIKNSLQNISDAKDQMVFIESIPKEQMGVFEELINSARDLQTLANSRKRN